VTRADRYARFLAIAAVAGVAWLLTPAIFDLDDAYIALHSAQVAVDGADPVFDVSALTGATSPVYVALLAALIHTGIPGLLALRLATAAGAAAYALALWRLGGALTLSVRHTIALIALTLGSGLALMQATNGLETGWALALSTWLISEAIRRRAFTTAAGAALLPFLRPDLGPAAVVLFVYACREQPLRGKATCAAIGLLVAAPLVLWLHHDTGEWVPQTLQAKAFFYAEMCRPFEEKALALYTASANYLLMMAPLAICSLALWREPLGRSGLAAIALTLAAFLIAFPGGLFHNDSRYLYAIATPWLSLGAAVQFSRRGLLARTPAIVALLGIALAARSFLQPDRAALAEELRRVSSWVEQHVPREDVVLIHDAGAISVFARHRAVDVVGLKTIASIEAHRQWTVPSCGRERAHAVAEIARRSHASYAVVASTWDDVFQLRSGLEASGFTMTPLRSPEQEQRGYTVYRLDADTQ
jgi:hypothetical protein